MRFVYLDSRFTLHASFPRSVALTQLRFTCLAVASSAGDFHPEECAHAGRTWQKAPGASAPRAFVSQRSAAHTLWQAAPQALLYGIGIAAPGATPLKPTLSLRGTSYRCDVMSFFQ